MAGCKGLTVYIYIPSCMENIRLDWLKGVFAVKVLQFIFVGAKIKLEVLKVEENDLVNFFFNSIYL